MSDDLFTYEPRMATTELERILRSEERCTKLNCTSRICVWRTPGNHGFTAPNPLAVPTVPIRTLQDLRVKSGNPMLRLRAVCAKLA